MKKVAYAIGIAVCIFALVIIASGIYAKKIDSDCRHGKGEKGVAACSFIIERVPFKVLKWAYRYSRAEHLYEAGRKYEALAELDDVIRMYESGEVPPVSDKSAVYVYALAAYYNYKEGNLAAAGKYADSAIRKGSGKTGMLIIRADSLLKAGNYQEALADLQKAEEAGYPKTELYVKRGLAYRGLGEDQQAYDSLKAAEPLMTDRGRLAVLNKELGFACYNLKNYDEALTHLNEAVAAGEPCPQCLAVIAKINQKPARPASKKHK